jgi:hypothetical protein
MWNKEHFIIMLIAKYYYGDKIKEYEIGREGQNALDKW